MEAEKASKQIQKEDCRKEPTKKDRHDKLQENIIQRETDYDQENISTEGRQIQQETEATYAGLEINCTQMQNYDAGESNFMQVADSTFDSSQMSCSQMLRQMMTTQNMSSINDEQSTYLMDAPIDSFTRMLTEAYYFENNMVITTSRIGEETTDYTYGNTFAKSNVPSNECDNTSNKEASTLNCNSEIENLDPTEEELEEHWYIDLFKRIEHSEEGMRQQIHVEREEEDEQEQDQEDVVNNTNKNTSQDQQIEHLEEEDVENFLENERIASSQEKVSEIDSQYVPHEGMEFSTSSEGHKFFNYYGYLAGFAVVIAHHARTQSRKRNKEIIRITYKCNRQGMQDTSKEGNTQEEEIIAERDTNVLVKTNCKCCMVISERKGIWRVTRLQLEHNHPMSPGAKYFRAHKNMTDQEKKMIRTLHECNIPTKKMMYLLSFLRGSLGATPYRDKDITNYRGKISRETNQNDMMQALMYLTKKKEEDPSFYFRFLVDSTHKVKCIFWTDPRSIRYYQNFGDCVSFDTTYLTNKYRMPFAPFAGITGHGLTCIFGCALIFYETTNTFKWLFQTFLEAVGGKEPISIMTDQDGAMRSAIAQIFPNASHRSCVFHIKYKAELKCGRRHIKKILERNSKTL